MGHQRTVSDRGQLLVSVTVVLGMWLGARARASESHSLKWTVDGRVSRGDKTPRTELESVSGAFEFGDSLFLIGYDIDRNGSNHPRIVQVRSGLQLAGSWAFEFSLAQVFFLRGAAHLVDTSGGVYRLEKGQWSPAGFRAPAHSWIVVVNDKLIACQPTPWQKESRERPGCTSLTNGWSITAQWRDTRPIACNDELLVLDDLGRKPVLYRIKAEDGTVLERKSVLKKTTLCRPTPR